jgi:3-hydroxypropanoate dehydrogenase
MGPDRTLDQKALETLFFDARTYNSWQEKDVPDSLLQKIHDTCRWGPTSANCCPMRIVFVKSKEQKEIMRPILDKGNVDKTMAAPVTAVIAYDRKFYDRMGKLSPRIDVEKWYGGKDALVAETAWRNGTLQAGYFILAARALGLDCGPMSGFKKDEMKKAFFPDLEGDVNFICNLGYGDPVTLYPRGARLDFDEACKIV